MRFDFDTFANRYPDSHLVAGRLEEPFAGPEIGALGRHLRRIIEAMGTPEYATGLVRTGPDLEYHFRFARSEDAEAFAACFGARHQSKPIPRHHFSIDRKLYKELAGRKRQRGGSAQRQLRPTKEG